MRTFTSKLMVLTVLVGLSSEVFAEEVLPVADAAPPSTETLLELNRKMAQRMKEFETQMQWMRAQLAAVQAAQKASAPEPSNPNDPYAWGDFTWLNGSSRQTSHVLDTKWFTPQFDVDVNYTYSFNNPIDHTIVGSTATFRHNELELAFLGIGGDAHIGNVRGRVFFQFGERAVGVPRNDVSANRGQYDLQASLRYLSEAYVGYHFDRMKGINVDAGLFFSYVGLFSYTQFENWGYQASFTSDNTPWFFNGLRIQLFPSDRLKVELWLINGWQTYGKFNELPGIGYQIDYRPREWCKIVLSAYVGTDTQDNPGRVRFHTDNSLLIRYYNKPHSKGLSRIASSLTFDLGFEEGGGVVAFRGANTPGNCTKDHPCEQDFLSAMLYYNFWFYKNKLSFMVGGGFMRNPGRYLVLVPAGVASTAYDTRNGTTFLGFDTSQNISFHPTDNLTIRLENSYHHADNNYYSGHGGVTGPDGYKCGGLYNADGLASTCAPTGWTPDLVKDEDKLILALLFRL